MAGEITTTLFGNLTSDPDMKMVNGTVVAEFRVACNTRVRGRNGHWTNGRTDFVQCSVWGDQADHVEASLHRGDRIFVHGSIRSNGWVNSDGEVMSTLRMTVFEVGPTLRFHTAAVTKAELTADAVDRWSDVAEDPAASADDDLVGVGDPGF